MVHKRTRRRLRGGSKRRTVKRTKRRTVKRTKRRIKGGSKRRTKRRNLNKRGGYIGEDWKNRRRLKNEYEQELAVFNRKSKQDQEKWMNLEEFPQLHKIPGTWSALAPDAGGPPLSEGIEARAEEFRKKMKEDYETKVTLERDARHKLDGKTSENRLKYEKERREAEDEAVKKYRAWKKGKATAQVKKLGLDGVGDKVNDIEQRLAKVEALLSPSAADVESEAELMAQLEADIMNLESTSDFDISELKADTGAGVGVGAARPLLFKPMIGSRAAPAVATTTPRTAKAVVPVDERARAWLDEKKAKEAAAKAAKA
jgi:hypothetical protein